MKVLVFILAFLVTFSTFGSELPTMVHSQTLTHVVVNGAPSDLVGIVELDFTARAITLRLYQDRCGYFSLDNHLARCMLMPTLEQEIIVPLRTRTSICGSAFYAGSLENVLVEGFSASILVKDHTRRTCADMKPAVEVIAVVDSITEGGRTVYRASTQSFEADSL